MSPTYEVGQAVRVAQGVKRHSGVPGFVVMVNETGGPLVEPAPATMPLGDRDSLPREPEYGVVLTTHRPPWRPDAPGQLSYDSDAVRWFRPDELTARTTS